MTQFDGYGKILDTLLVDRERGIRLSNAKKRAADALAVRAPETSETARGSLLGVKTAPCTDTIFGVTIELCYNDNRTASKNRSVNIQLIDANGCRICWDRTVSGSWAGTWENRPDLGSPLLNLLETIGLKPAGIHIGDDEAYSRRQVASIDSAADLLRRSGYRVVVKR
jgi:hypothetical protein